MSQALSTPPATFGVRLIADRVLLRIDGEAGWRTAELSLEQAKQARAYLDEAILALESGLSVVNNLPELISTLD